MRVPRLIVCLIATGVIGALSAAPAWALSPSNANFTFQVGSTVNPGNTPDAVIAKAILVWKPGERTSAPPAAPTRSSIAPIR